MRWQKAARLVIAAVVVGFAAFVFVALRRPAPAPAPPPPAMTDPKASAEIRGTGTFTQPLANGRLIRVDFDSQIVYDDGRSILKDVVITLPDRDGKPVVIRGAQLETSTPAGSATPLGTARLSGGVTLTTSDGLEVKAAEATFEEKTDVISVPGAVQFARGRMTGSGVGATYDMGRSVLWLLAEARLNVKPDKDGGGALDATAGSAGLARAEHYIRLSKPAHLVSDGRALDADDMTIQLSDNDTVIETMALRGNSIVSGTSAGTGAGAEGMSARDIDLTMGPDGRVVQGARLMESAVVRLAGPGGGGKQIAARTIDLQFAEGGGAVTGLNASENVVVDLPAAAAAPARRITAATLVAGGASGLQNATFGGGVSYRELRAGARGAPPAERTARSSRLQIETEPGLGDIKRADFRGNVHIVDGTTVADAQRAIYNVAQDTFDLAPSSGDPGPPTTVNDGRVIVTARTISINVTTKSLRADTDVRSSMQPEKRTGKPAPGRGSTARGSGSRLPSMLKQDEPVMVTSNQLESDGATGIGTYTGGAKLFQGQTSVKADTIVLDDRTANMQARGRVETVMFFDETDAKTKTTKPVPTYAFGDTLVYEDAKRLATYRTGASGRARINGTQGDVTADVIQLFLKRDANELDRAEADGQVVVKEGVRTATGRHLTYTPANETYVMTGSPVEIEERTPAECRLMVGSSVTFHKTTSNMSVENNAVTPINMKPCAATAPGAS